MINEINLWNTISKFLVFKIKSKHFTQHLYFLLDSRALSIHSLDIHSPHFIIIIIIIISCRLHGYP